jgi:alanyl-tRNA synthetase
MPSLSANEIRRQFIDFFVQRCGHTFVSSSPCVPLDDPTLMFTNAGMNQFKDVFLATGSRPYTRAANTQKCIRAGGKHNDLDDVGHDTYHHTFFEMLGNWSFGDYFKQEAIGWAWELLTVAWGLDRSRLHATYFEGSEAEGVPADTEARDLWLGMPGMDPGHVHPGRMKDNFWEMGDTGPCGPCSEIHIDLTPDRSGGRLVNAGDARVMEIWNLVFIQFNRGPDGALSPLPARHVDTGMGFERITALLQGKKSNYDTDIFTPIFSAIRQATGAPAYTGLLAAGEGRGGQPPQLMVDVAYRVIADHLRCLTFALTDGAEPSNEGRGYVLRRILRRAVRYGRQYLGTREPFLCRLVPAVVEAMGEAFPELARNPGRVAEVIRDEEQSFIRTLDRGIALFEEAAEYAQTHHHGRIGGEDAFRLHDTFGFPIDLTELMAEERGLTVNIGEYERLMEEARDRARAGGKTISQMSLQVSGALPPTDDLPKYEGLALEARIIGFIRDNQYHAAGELPLMGDIGVVLDRTCAYGEQGGQVGDRGLIRSGDSRFTLDATVRLGDTVVHWGRLQQGLLRVGDAVQIEIDPIRRRTMQNHTATHLLNWALRDVLGDHVHQKGSLVDPDKTRFDFSHNAQLSEDELAGIEERVNARISRDLPVHTREVDQAAARRIHTLRAVFGEKYPDRVRVVSIGADIDQMLADPANPAWMGYSVEFCGGTHLSRTGEAECFRLIEESAVAKGVRRVTGVSGERAREVERAGRMLLAQLAQARELREDALPDRVASLAGQVAQAELPVVDAARLRAGLGELQDRLRKRHKEQARQGAAEVMSRADSLLGGAERVGGHAIIVGQVGAAGVDPLRSACDSLRSRAGSAAILLASENDGKVLLLAAMTPDLVGRGIRAGDLIREIAPIVGGKGGGKPDLAQGGGPDLAKTDEALQAGKSWLQARLRA